VIVPATVGVVPGTAVVDVPVPGVAVVVPGVVVVVPGVVVVGVVVVVLGVVTVVLGVVVVVDDGVVVEPPARLIAAPHVAAVLVLVSSTSVTINVCPAGTVKAVTAVVPGGTCCVISTTLRTVGVAPVAAAMGSAFAPDTVVGASGDDVVGIAVPGASVVVPPTPIVDVWADSWPTATSATRAHRHRTSNVTTFMKTSWTELAPARTQCGCQRLPERSDECQAIGGR